jgi:hypothetical protein
MKSGLTTLLISLATLTISSQSFARDQEFKRGHGQWRGNENSERVNQLRSGKASYGGNGCPDGTMSVAFAPDNLSFSILYDQFVAQVDPASSPKKGGAQKDTMSCSINVPIEIPENMRMEITRVDFRGFAGLPQGAKAQLVSNFDFLGDNRAYGGKHRGSDQFNLRQVFTGPMMENYEITTDDMTRSRRFSESEKSPCGGSTQLRIANRLQISSRSASESSTVTLDSIDTSGVTVYYVNWSKCDPGPSKRR